VAEAVGVGQGRASRAAYRVMRALRTFSLRRAAVNVAIGERMAQQLSDLGVASDRIRIIPNWADGALVRPLETFANPLRSDWGLKDKFVVGYSGNLGRAHEFATPLDAIERVERKRSAQDVSIGDADGSPQVVWLFIGGGTLYEVLQAEVRRRGLNSVEFRPYQPRERLAESLSAADLHLVSLRPELEGLIVPSKIYGILAAGRPALFIGRDDSEVAQLLAVSACGRTVAIGDGAALAETVLALAREPATVREMGRQARQIFESEFDKGAAVARWERLLADLSQLRTKLPEREAVQPSAAVVSGSQAG